MSQPTIPASAFLWGGIIPASEMFPAGYEGQRRVIKTKNSWGETVPYGFQYSEAEGAWWCLGKVDARVVRSRGYSMDNEGALLQYVYDYL